MMSAMVHTIFQNAMRGNQVEDATVGRIAAAGERVRARVPLAQRGGALRRPQPRVDRQGR